MGDVGEPSFEVGDVWQNLRQTWTVLAVHDAVVLVAYAYEGERRDMLPLPKRLFAEGACGAKQPHAGL